MNCFILSECKEEAEDPDGGGDAPVDPYGGGDAPDDAGGGGDASDVILVRSSPKVPLRGSE